MAEKRSQDPEDSLDNQEDGSSVPEWICEAAVTKSSIFNLSFMLRNILPFDQLEGHDMGELAGPGGEMFLHNEGSKYLNLLHSGSSAQGLSLPPYHSTVVSDGKIVWINADCDVMSVLKSVVVTGDNDAVGEDVAQLDLLSDENDADYSESDSVMSFTETPETPNSDTYMVITDSTRSYPGFTRIRCPREVRSSLFGQDFSIAVTEETDFDYLSSTLMVKLFASMQEDEFDAEKFANLLPMSKASMGKILKRDFCGIAGPSISFVNYNLAYGTMSDVQGDVVLCVAHPAWPTEARGWLSRDRPSGWPGKSLLRRVATNGCHLTPTTHKESQDPDTEWRFSFSLAEGFLSSSLNNTQKQCFVLMKIVQKFVLNRPEKVLTSYHLKTIFYWLLERYPQNHCVQVMIGHLFLTFLDEVLCKLASHNIPNYFIPESNLLEHVPRQFVHDLAKRLSAVRKDPIRFFLRFSEKYRFYFSPVEPLKQLLDPVLNLSKSATFKDACFAQIKSLLLFLASYMRTERVLTELEPSVPTGSGGVYECRLSEDGTRVYSFDYAVVTESVLKITKELIAVQRVLGHDPDFPSCLCTAAKQLPSPLSRQLLMFIMKTYVRALSMNNPEDTEYNVQWEIENTELEKLANAAFVPSIGHAGNVSEMFEYGRFLCNIGRFLDGEKILLEVLNEGATECLNFYSLTHFKSLDENLEQEINSMCFEKVHPVIQFIEICTRVHAGYVLVKLYLQQDDSDKASTVAQKLIEVCEHVPTRHRALSFSLLGYSLQMTGHLEQAKVAFGKVLELQPDSDLAEKNYEQFMNMN